MRNSTIFLEFSKTNVCDRENVYNICKVAKMGYITYCFGFQSICNFLDVKDKVTKIDDFEVSFAQNPNKKGILLD